MAASSKGQATGGKTVREVADLPGAIEVDRAREHAMLVTRRTFVGGGDELAAVARSSVGGPALTVNDLDGRPLFHEFEATDDEGVVATIRASASQLLGPAVLSTSLGPRRWNPDAAIDGAVAAAKAACKGLRIKITGTELVCYCWPKVGVRVWFSAPELGETSVIIDASQLVPVEHFGSQRGEGSTAYSFYAEEVASHLDARQRRWAFEEEDLDLLRNRVPELLEPDRLSFDPERIHDFRLRLAEPIKLQWLLLNQQQVVRFGPRCAPHECMELYAQQTDVFCAVATGQMILDFYKWHVTQDQLAATMGTNSGGTSQQGQIDGYQGRSNGCLVATLDTSADWAEAIAEIDANRPFKSGIPGHARCGAGYEWSWSWSRRGFDRRLKVYDPWPWNADICKGGTITWEDWDTVTHTNFMYVRHQTSTH